VLKQNTFRVDPDLLLDYTVRQVGRPSTVVNHSAPFISFPKYDRKTVIFPGIGTTLTFELLQYNPTVASVLLTTLN
jgi:hypothetical protein